MRLIRLSELLPPPSFGGYDGFTVHVYGGEGSIPHAHLLRKGENRNTNKICICLHSDTYFHNEKLKTNDRRSRGLSGGDRDNLLDYMLSEPTKDKDIYSNRWEQLCGEWNIRNPKHRFTKPAVMPHYDRMSTSPEEADEILKVLRRIQE